jgi:hypothetical protein
MKIAGSGSKIRIRIHPLVRGKVPGSGSTPKCHGLKNTVNSRPEGRDGHGAAHVEVFIQPEAKMALAGAHHEARGPPSHNIVVLTRPPVHLPTKIFLFHFNYGRSNSDLEPASPDSEPDLLQTWIRIWNRASWIRIRGMDPDPDPSIAKQK